jgi:hypothetical protein
MVGGIVEQPKVKTPGRFKLIKAGLGITPLSDSEAAALVLRKQQEQAAKQKKEQQEAAKKQAKADKVAFKLELKQTEAQAHYERLAKEAAEASDALSGLRGAIVQLQAIETGRTAAATLAEAKDFVGATKSLEKLGAVGLRDKGLEAEDKAAKLVEKKYADVTKLANDIKTSLPTYPISADQQAQFSDDVDVMTAPLKSPEADESIADIIKERLEGVQDEIEQARAAGEAARDRYLAATARATPLITELEQSAADTEIAPLIRDMTLATGLSRSKDFTRAADLAEWVVAEAGTVKAAAEKGKADWAKSASTLPKLLQAAGDLAANDSPVLTAREPKAAAILKRLEALRGQVEAGDIGRRVSYADAAKVIDETFVQIAELNITLEKFGEFGQKAEDSDAQVVAATSKIRTALTAMHEAMAETLMGKSLPSDASFGARLETILKEWDKTRSFAVTEAELALPTVLAKLATLQSDIDAVAGDSGEQFKMHRDQLFATAREKFDRAETACATPLATLFESSITDAMKFQAEIDKAVAAVGKATRPADIDAQTLILEALPARITDIGKKLASTIDNARAEAERAAREVRNALAAFEQAVAERKEKQKHNPLKNDAVLYTQQLEALQSDFSQVESVIPVADFEGLTEASAELRAQLANTKAAMAALKGGRDNEGASIITLSSLASDLKDLRAKLDRKDFRNHIAVTQAKLIDKAEDLKDKIPTLPIPTAAKLLEEIETGYDEAKKLVAKAEGVAKEFETSVAQGLKILAEQKAAFKAAPAAYAEYQARIKACQDSARVEGEIESARKKMLDILVELQAAVNDPAKIAQGQTNAEEAKKKAQQDKARFEGQYDSFSKTLASYAEIKSKDRKDIETLAKNAKKAFDANGDFNAAMIQLNAARQRAELLHKYPEGQSVATRNNLPKVVAKWKTAAGNFGQSLSALEGKIEAIDDTPHYAAAKAAALKTIGEVKPLLNPTAFDAAVAKMTAKGAAPTAMTAGREEGLRIVRRYNAYIEKDFRFMELAGNPFEPGVKADTVAIHLALADLENNLLISL